MPPKLWALQLVSRVHNRLAPGIYAWVTKREILEKPPLKEAFETLDPSRERLQQKEIKGTNNEYCYACNGS